MPEVPKLTSPPATSPPAKVIEQPAVPAQQNGSTYVLNTSTHKFHYSSCPSIISTNKSKKIITVVQEKILFQWVMSLVSAVMHKIIEE